MLYWMLNKQYDFEFEVKEENKEGSIFVDNWRKIVL